MESEDDDLQLLRDYERGDVVIEYWYDYASRESEWRVVNESETHIRDGRHQARSLAIVLNQYDVKRIDDVDDNLIPAHIAIRGKPPITTYLCGVHNHSPSEVADIMEVSRETVLKYLYRADPQRPDS